MILIGTWLNSEKAITCYNRCVANFQTWMQGSDAAFAVTASYKKESPMDELLNGKSIKADFEAQVTTALMIQSHALIPLKLALDLYGDLAGILNMSLETKDMKILDKLCLNASNDNKAINGAFTHIDRIGSGGRI